MNNSVLRYCHVNIKMLFRDGIDIYLLLFIMSSIMDIVLLLAFYYFIILYFQDSLYFFYAIRKIVLRYSMLTIFMHFINSCNILIRIKDYQELCFIFFVNLLFYVLLHCLILFMFIFLLYFPHSLLVLCFLSHDGIFIYLIFLATRFEIKIKYFIVFL